VRDDLIRPLHGATVAIDVMRWLMWIVAAVIIGAVTYLSALERVRDFAVLKAVGGSSLSLALSLAAQAVLASIAAAVLAIGLAQLLKPLFPLPVDITAQAYLALPAIAMLVGVLSSLAALRRAVGVDPALAFAG
jgi:putative ABC transport system permease protein